LSHALAEAPRPDHAAAYRPPAADAAGCRQGAQLDRRAAKKFAELQKENRKELEEIIHAKNKEGRNENLAKHRESTRTKIRALLTDEQKKKVEEIVGAPFKGEIVFEEPEASKDKPDK
jgi:hypothetical protein